MKPRQISYRTLLLVLGSGGLLAVLAVWRFGYHGVDPRLIFWPPPAELPAPAALAEPAEIDVTDEPLDKVLFALGRKYNVPIELDSFALARCNVTGQEKVTLRLSGVSLGSLLNHLGRPLGLDMRSRGGVAYLTNNAWSNNLANYTDRVYTLESLLAGPHEIDEVELVDLVTTLVKPHTWSDVSGMGVCQALPGALFVSQTPDVQDEVARLLAALAKANEESSSTVPVPLAAPTKATVAIHEALAEPAKLDFGRITLQEMADRISRQYGIAVVLDTGSLAELDVTPESYISIYGWEEELSLRSALGHLLREQGLCFVVQDEAILITTLEWADLWLSIRVYSVADLLEGAYGINAERLIEVITSTLSPGSWGHSGGEGKLKCPAGCLVVLQTDAVHKQLEALLAELRRAVRPAPLVVPPPQPTVAQARLESVLATRVSFDFQYKHIRDLLADLREQHQIAVQIDERALAKAGVVVDLKNPSLSFQCENVPLELALRWMFAPLGMAPSVVDEALAITSAEVANSRQEIRCYRIPARLAAATRALDPSGFNAGSLDSSITVVLDPHTWSDYGGPGGQEALGNVLVVSQTREVHTSLADLLAKLETLEQAPPGAAPTWVGEWAEERYARIDAALAEPLDLPEWSAPPLLEDVVDAIQDAHHIPITYDPFLLKTNALFRGIAARRGRDADEATQAATRPDERRVNTQRPKASLRLGLELMLREIELSYRVCDGAVQITSPTFPGADTWLRLYDVRVLQNSPGDHRNNASGLLEELIAVLNWHDSDGPGKVEQVGGLLLVNQTPEVHWQIERLLLALAAPPPEGHQPVVLPFDSSGSEEKLEVALAQRVSLALDDVPLGTALEMLAREQQVSIVVDRGALPEVAIYLKDSVTVHVDDVPFEDALDEVLAKAQFGRARLGWRPVDGALLVTSGELAAARGLWTRLYPVSDLFAAAPILLAAPPESSPTPYLDRFRLSVGAVPAAPWQDPTHPLANLLMECLETTFSLHDAGSRVQVCGPWLVLATQQRAPHRAVEPFLARLRGVAAGTARDDLAAPLQPALEGSPNVPRLAVYDLRPFCIGNAGDGGAERHGERSLQDVESWLRWQFGPHDGSSVPLQNRYSSLSNDPPLGIWSGLLIAALTPAADAKLRAALELLARGSADLPPPNDICQRIESENDPLRLAHALWLSSRLPPSAKIAAALSERLNRSDPRDEPLRCAQLWRALAHCGPLAADAVPTLAAQFQLPISPKCRWELAETLAALGPRGINEVWRLAVERDDYDIDQLLKRPEFRSKAMPWLLNRLSDRTNMHRLRLIDRRGEEWWRVFDQLRSEAANANAGGETMGRFDELEKLLTSQFGVRKRMKGQRP